MRISLLQQGLPLDVDFHSNSHKSLLCLSKPGSVHLVLCAHPTPHYQPTVFKASWQHTYLKRQLRCWAAVAGLPLELQAVERTS